MTYTEIAAHLSTDQQEALAFCKGIKFKRYRSEAIKLKRYPLFFRPLFFQSSQRNRWFVLPHVRTKSDLDKLPYYVGCIFSKFGKDFLFMQMEVDASGSQLPLRFIFTGRFFERYAARTGQEDMAPDELVISFVKQLHLVGIKDQVSRGVTRRILMNPTGICLGYPGQQDDDLSVFHTYISADNGPQELRQLHHECMLITDVFYS